MPVNCLPPSEFPNYFKVVGDFEDNYDNLPIKTFLGYKFLNEKCNGKYEFATFTDDDAFIDWPMIKRYLKETNYESSSVHCLKGLISYYI